MIIICIILVVLIVYLICEAIYFNCENFKNIKESIAAHTKNCNELNEHIEELKNAYIDIKQIDYGSGIYTDRSKWNYKRPELKKIRQKGNVYNCSRTICDNARKQPFKYICKYFNISSNEETLAKFENILNDFNSAENGKRLLIAERDEIVKSISNDIPLLIRTFSKKKLIKKLGFHDIDLSTMYFPKYSFVYVSSGGNASMTFDFVFDLEQLDRFVNYLAEKVKFKKSVAGQRALMTSALREQIKRRDNYTCKCCGVSTQQEPHLLLEIDHVIPLAKGGLTSVDNLQTLCWKCNRTKGAKIMD